MKSVDEEFKNAVLSNNLKTIRICAYALRLLGEQYSDIYALARSVKPNLTVDEWDKTLLEAEETC